MDPLVPHSSHLSLAEQDAGDRSQILLEENMVLQRLGQVTMDSEEPQMTVTQTININREAGTGKLYLITVLFTTLYNIVRANSKLMLLA